MFALVLALGGASPEFRLSKSSQQLGEATDLAMDVVTGDVDGDGDADVLVAGLGMPTRVWINPGNPMFAGEPLALESDSDSKVALGDRDRDGDVNVVLAEQALSVWLNPGRSPRNSPSVWIPNAVRASPPKSPIIWGVVP